MRALHAHYASGAPIALHFQTLTLSHPNAPSCAAINDFPLLESYFHEEASPNLSDIQRPNIPAATLLSCITNPIR